MDLSEATTTQGMNTAFADLEALMNKAQDMVRLAKDLNEQLTAATARNNESSIPIEPEEATFVRSSLAQLGLSMKNAPVTADMIRDERRYVEQLARELAGVLLGDSGSGGGTQAGVGVGIMRERGIVGLDEVWGGWNRARGVALISPEMTLKALPHLPLYSSPPIHTRTLVSGLRVLHTPAYTTSEFAVRLLSLILELGPRTSAEVAAVEGLSVGLVDELILESEERGDICRDDIASGSSAATGSAGVETRWWANVFVGYVWDGQVD